MGKAVMISIQPQWCELIANGRKTVEVRKSGPKLEAPFKCYIYCTNKRPFLVWGDVFRGNWETEFTHLSGYSRAEAEKIWDVFNGKVMGEFVCDDCSLLTKAHYEYIEKSGCIPKQFLKEYMGIEEGQELAPTDGCYGWHISDLVVYDTPKPLSEFYKCGAEPMDALDEILCAHCSATDYGRVKESHTPNGVYMCEGRWCADAYQEYLDDKFALNRPPQSWCYVEVSDDG